MPPTAVATTGTPHAIASSATMPNGSYQGAHTTASAERSNAGTSRAGDLAEEPHPVRDAAPPASVLQPRAVGIRPSRGTARDDELGLGHPRQRGDHLVDALAAHEPADAHHPRPAGAPLGDRPVRGERARVDAAGHHGHAMAVGAHPDQLEQLVVARREDPVGAAGERPLGADPPGGLVSAPRWWRRLTLPSAWKVWTNGTSLVSQRRGRREPGHPEVRVHDVGRLGAPGPSEPVGQRGHVRYEIVLRDRPRGPGVDVADDDAGVQRHELGQGRVVAAGEHGDLVARGGERPAQLADVHVLPPGVGAAESGEGARVLGNESNPHTISSGHGLTDPDFYRQGRSQTGALRVAMVNEQHPDRQTRSAVAPPWVRLPARGRVARITSGVEVGNGPWAGVSRRGRRPRGR